MHGQLWVGIPSSTSWEVSKHHGLFYDLQCKQLHTYAARYQIDSLYACMICYSSNMFFQKLINIQTQGSSVQQHLFLLSGSCNVGYCVDNTRCSSVEATSWSSFCKQVKKAVSPFLSSSTCLYKWTTSTTTKAIIIVQQEPEEWMHLSSPICSAILYLFF